MLPNPPVIFENEVDIATLSAGTVSVTIPTGKKITSITLVASGATNYGSYAKLGLVHDSTSFETLADGTLGTYLKSTYNKSVCWQGSVRVPKSQKSTQCDLSAQIFNLTEGTLKYKLSAVVED